LYRVAAGAIPEVRTGLNGVKPRVSFLLPLPRGEGGGEGIAAIAALKTVARSASSLTRASRDLSPRRGEELQLALNSVPFGTVMSRLGDALTVQRTISIRRR
jgi:hypothetical protein